MNSFTEIRKYVAQQAQNWDLLGGPSSAIARDILNDELSARLFAVVVSISHEVRRASAARIRWEMEEIMEEFSDFGATDSEPRNRLYALLSDWFGVDQIPSTFCAASSYAL